MWVRAEVSNSAIFAGPCRRLPRNRPPTAAPADDWRQVLHQRAGRRLLRRAGVTAATIATRPSAARRPGTRRRRQRRLGQVGERPQALAIELVDAANDHRERADRDGAAGGRPRAGRPSRRGLQLADLLLRLGQLRRLLLDLRGELRGGDVGRRRGPLQLVGAARR